MSKRPDTSKSRAGFTLIEALVALSMVLAFAMTLGPLLFDSRQILLRGDDQIRAQVLLRSLVAEPFDRARVGPGTRFGESGTLRWRVAIEPADPQLIPTRAELGLAAEDKRINWALFRVTASVSYGPGKRVSAETFRLGAVKE